MCNKEKMSSSRYWSAATLLQQRPTKNIVPLDTVLSFERQLLWEAFQDCSDIHGRQANITSTY